MRDVPQDLVDIRWRQGTGRRQVGLAGSSVFAAKTYR